MTTAYHAKYFAHDLTRRATEGVDRLSSALFDASVDLNPHQIEAAVFALQSPLSKGVILADEVGLGKTPKAAPPTRSKRSAKPSRRASSFASTGPNADGGCS